MQCGWIDVNTADAHIHLPHTPQWIAHGWVVISCEELM